MPLTPCKECGNQISKTAATCPQCGAKVPHTSLVAKLVAAFFVILFVAVIFSSKQQTTQSSVTMPTPAQSVNEPPSTDVHWLYDTSQDRMGRGTIKTAQVSSDNQIEFDFPYQVPQRATLMLRTHPKYGKNVILRIERGQFLCGVDDCPVSVRFDEGKVQVYNAAEPSDHTTTALFLRGYERFIAGLRNSHKVSVEAKFYQEGNRVFEFNTSGLNWEGAKKTAEKTAEKAAGMQIVFDKGVSPETKAGILAILHRQIDDASFNDPNYLMHFWSDDGFYITYEVRYKDEVRHSSNGTAMSPGAFEEEIQTAW